MDCTYKERVILAVQRTMAHMVKYGTEGSAKNVSNISSCKSDSRIANVHQSVCLLQNQMSASKNQT